MATMHTKVKRYNFILLSGGPGLFDPNDKEHHDQSWHSFVTPPGLLYRRGNFVKLDEAVHWLIYRPAYENRWKDDVKNPSRRPFITKAVNDIRSKGRTSYIDRVDDLAKRRSWTLYWLKSAAEFWTKIASFHEPISRVWYWGHASDDLWLSLRHAPFAITFPDGYTLPQGGALSPDPNAMITRDSVSNNRLLKAKFVPNDRNRVHCFTGCNTSAFARKWAETFGVYAEGVEGKVNFADIYKEGGEGGLSPGAYSVQYDANGRVHRVRLAPLDLAAKVPPR
jgi:hypothetical protein